MKILIWCLSVTFIMASSLPLPSGYDPFLPPQIKKKILKKSFKKSKKTSLRLEAIFNDKALINGRWIGVGEMIAGFKLVRVAATYVLLVRKNFIKVLPLFHKKILDVSR